MSEYTPAPWIYGKRDDGSFWISLGTPLRTHEQFDWFGENEASLRLACAAPNLLAALKGLLAECEWDTDSEAALNAARTAIAKAEAAE